MRQTHQTLSWVSENASRQRCKALSYLGGVAVIKCVLHHQVLQHLDGDLTSLPELLQRCVDLPEQQPDQEVVLTEVICQRVIQLQV